MGIQSDESCQLFAKRPIKLYIFAERPAFALAEFNGNARLLTLWVDELKAV